MDAGGLLLVLFSVVVETVGPRLAVVPGDGEHHKSLREK